jgi:acyl dehydratase
MPHPAEQALAAWKRHEGSVEGVGAWHTIVQAQINAFADATLDHQFIHVDPVKAAEHSPYKVPIAHGFLTLSLIPHLVSSALQSDPERNQGLQAAINYGLDRVRFPAPVKVNSRVRAQCELVSVEQVAPNVLQVKRKVTVQIENEDKPACIAETLVRLVYG